ncbi:hypothetical protein SDC9_172447 [bioreactor metagenome]|uniref:Uncharacterized protein n=1 Tax=bioreactor metagenome TaxID=1076179 RepID=A0A645GFZ3_9ZZZZ
MLDMRAPCLLQHTRHGALVKVEQKRRALTCGDHVHHFVQQRFRRILVQPHVRLGLENRTHLVDHFEKHPCELVGEIHAIPAHAGEVEELAVSRCNTLIARLNHCVIGIVTVHPEALEQFFAKFTVHALTDGLLPIGQQVLVDTSERNTRAGIVFVREHEHVREPQRL